MLNFFHWIYHKSRITNLKTYCTQIYTDKQESPVIRTHARAHTNIYSRSSLTLSFYIYILNISISLCALIKESDFVSVNKDLSRKRHGYRFYILPKVLEAVNSLSFALFSFYFCFLYVSFSTYACRPPSISFNGG